MTHAETVLRAIREALKDSGVLPHDVTYATLELDAGGIHADVQLPVVELYPQDIIRDTSRDSELVGYETDNQGNRYGRIYEARYDMPVVANVKTAQGGNHNPRTLAHEIRTALTAYDSYRIDNPLPDPDSRGQLDESVKLVIGDEFPENDFTTSPSLRVERLRFETQFDHRWRSSEIVGKYPSIESVVLPDPDDATLDTNGEQITLRE